MKSNNDLLEIRDREAPRGVGPQTGVFVGKARNAEVWDVEGKRYIDLAKRRNARASGVSQKQTSFVNAGSQAFEKTVKIVRKHEGRSRDVSAVIPELTESVKKAS